MAATRSEGVWVDDETIIYHADDLRNVWSIKASTGERQKLFNWSAVTPDGFSGHFALSPDRTRLLSNPQNGVWSPTQDLFICDLHGQNVRTVWEDAHNDIEDFNALWLPGDRFVWCRSGLPKPDQREMAIVTCRLGDTNYEVLTDWQGLKWPLAASPDGSQILFLKEIPPRGGGMELAIMNADGTQDRKFSDRTFVLVANSSGIGARWFARAAARR